MSAPKYVLVLRTCDEKMQSCHGFKWPKKGAVKCNDWKPIAECGNGLHGLLWGCGDADLLTPYDETRFWLVVRVLAREIVEIGEKVKFPRGTVILCTKKRDVAIGYLINHGAHDKPVVFGTSTSGDGGTSTSGDRGTSTSGDGGTSTSGYRGTSTSGDGGIIAIRWWDAEAQRYRLSVAYVGEDNIKLNTPYKLDDNGNFVEVVE